MSKNICESTVLNDEIFGGQPLACELQKSIDTMLAQFSLEVKNSPEIQGALNRIGSISDTLSSLAGETRSELVRLYATTVTKKHLGDYSSKIDILKAHQCARVANALGVPANDSKISKVA